MTTSRRHSRVVRRRLLRRKCHTNVKNGGTEWIEGRRKPTEVVCVDNVMTVGR